MKLTLKNFLKLLGLALLFTLLIVGNVVLDQECQDKGGTRIKVPGGTKCVQIKEIP